MTRRDGYERLLWYVESSKLLVALCHFDEFWAALLAQYACGHSMTLKPISVGTHSWAHFSYLGVLAHRSLFFVHPHVCSLAYLCASAATGVL